MSKPTYEELEKRVKELKRIETERKKAEETLKQKNIELYSFINNIPDMAWLKDKNSNFIAANKAFGEAVGMDQEYLINNTCEVCFGKEAAEKFKKDDKKVMKSRKQTVIEEEITNAKGDRVYLETIKSPILDETGNVIGTVGIARDITKRKDVEEGREKLLKAIETTKEAISITTPDIEMIYTNDAMDELFGYETGELIGKHVSILNAGPPPKAMKLLKQITNAIKKKSFWEGETHNKRKDGTEFISHSKITALTDENGKTINYISTQNDITERKKAEEVLKESEEKYRDLADSIGDMFFSLDKNLKYTFRNKKADDSFGLSAGDAIGKSPFDIFTNTESTDKMMDFYREVLETKQPNNVVNHFMKDGKKCFLDFRIYPSKKGISVIAKDITERKKAEEYMRFLSSITENISDSIVVTDTNFNITYINKTFEELFGYKLEELKGKTPEILNAEPTAHEIQQKIYKTISSGKTLLSENLNKRKDGTTFYCEYKVMPLEDEKGNIYSYVGIQRDITERKKAEEALRESEKRFRELADLLPEIVFEINLNGILTYVNQKSYEMSGYTEEDFDKGFTAVNFLIQSDRQRAAENIKKILKSGMEINIRYTAQHKDGRTFPVMTRSAPIIKEGKSVGLRGIIFDISELELYEKSLKESEEKFRMMSEQSLMAIIILQEGEIKYVNQATTDMVEYSIEEMKEWNVGDYESNIHPDDREKVFEQVRKKQAGEQDVIAQYSYRIITKTGKTIWVENYSKTIQYKGKNAIFITLVDITERKKTEEERINLEKQLIQSQKIESMGRLAGAVAHDLNHVLTGLVTYPDILLLDMEKDDPLKEKIENIKKSGQTAAAIVEDLLSIARGGVADTEALNINNIIIDYTDSPEIKQIKKYNPDVIFDTELDPFLNSIISSEVQILKIIHNLTNNAVEAMPNDGRVLISTANKNIEKPIKGYEYVPKGEYVLLCVSDTGIGIQEADIKKVFEPYYTKKALGRTGSGIGLTVVWNIVKEHNGFIDVISEVGSGTVFHIYFPVTKDKIVKNDKIFKIEEYIGNGETVLIIDDEKSEREMGINLLEKLNYSPTAVSSGKEAIEYLKINKVDLLLLDMLLGKGMDGLDTYKEIRKICHDQKVIIISGFSASDKIKEAQKLGAGEFVKKPITVEEIGMVIKKELNKQ